MTQLEITAPPRMETHAENLERVTDRIAGHVLTFCREHTGKEFRMNDLLTYVFDCCHFSSPDSPGRILRDLRAKGRVGYELISRSQSLYKISWVRG